MLPPLIEHRRRCELRKDVGTAASAVPPSVARRPKLHGCQAPEGVHPHVNRAGERGVTIALVAVAIFSIIAMAGLSIDIGTLYEASAEAQRAADAGALAAARVISISGVTGDLTPHVPHWTAVCGGSTSPASTAATTVAQLNTIAGTSNATVTVTYGGTTVQNCASQPISFAVNPTVTVLVKQTNLPTYFSRIWGRSGSSVSATATAEVFNPSNSGAYSASGSVVPVQPRCVKPWVVPNQDPGNTGAVNTFVSAVDGSITNQGVYQSDGGVIGETFNLIADCVPGTANCLPPLSPAGHIYNNPPTRNVTTPPIPVPNLEYVPALVQGNAVAVPTGGSCSITGAYQSAIAGCDQTTAYTCGTTNATFGATQVNLAENPVWPSVVGGDTPVAVQCLINQASGQDTINPGTVTAPVFPFQIQAGAGNPLVTAGVVSSNAFITSSNSIVTIPIADFGVGALVPPQPAVTIVGFLQVFINSINGGTGAMNVTVINVSGCGDNTANPPLNGTSPVPVRLITPP